MSLSPVYKVRLLQTPWLFLLIGCLPVNKLDVIHLSLHCQCVLGITVFLDVSLLDGYIHSHIQ